MTRYKQTEFTEDDSSSIGGIQLNEATGHTGMQIRYHTARVSERPFGEPYVTCLWGITPLHIIPTRQSHTDRGTKLHLHLCGNGPKTNGKWGQRERFSHLPEGYHLTVKNLLLYVGVRWCELSILRDLHLYPTIWWGNQDFGGGLLLAILTF